MRLFFNTVAVANKLGKMKWLTVVKLFFPGANWQMLLWIPGDKNLIQSRTYSRQSVKTYFACVIIVVKVVFRYDYVIWCGK